MNNEEKLKEAKKFLGTLLDDTIEWSCTDTQHSLRDQFIEIIGEENVPTWILKPEEE